MTYIENEDGTDFGPCEVCGEPHGHYEGMNECRHCDGLCKPKTITPKEGRKLQRQSAISAACLLLIVVAVLTASAHCQENPFRSRLFWGSQTAVAVPLAISVHETMRYERICYNARLSCSDGGFWTHWTTSYQKPTPPERLWWVSVRSTGIYGAQFGVTALCWKYAGKPCLFLPALYTFIGSMVASNDAHNASRAEKLARQIRLGAPRRPTRFPLN